jgi:HlyD family secretion protein
MQKGRHFLFVPGMNASADIQTKTHANVLAVPINAVTTRDKNSKENHSKSAKKRMTKRTMKMHRLLL